MPTRIFQMTFFPLITTFEYERLFLHRPISNHYSLLVKNITKSNDNIERILMPKQSFPNENIVHWPVLPLHVSRTSHIFVWNFNRVPTKKYFCITPTKICDFTQKNSLRFMIYCTLIKLILKTPTKCTKNHLNAN